MLLKRSAKARITTHNAILPKPSERGQQWPRSFFWQRLGGSAGFETCCIAGFQAGKTLEMLSRSADLEIRDTADLEVCATLPSVD